MGIVPFEATVARAVPNGAGLAITLYVTNSGKATGSTTCHLVDPAARSSGMGAFILTPRIAPGATVTFTETVTGLGSAVHPFDVDCTTP